ncbi:MAG: hypothetical protein BMS9Abin02_0191 [Anaerolineae bacterium]|nr:MAG: hypothetical protein BMS9Abin02_0191 [Anaerolineae bacterium]
MIRKVHVAIGGAGFAGLTTGIDTLPLTADGATFFGGEQTDEDSRTIQGALTSNYSAARQKCEVFL